MIRSVLKIGGSLMDVSNDLLQSLTEASVDVLIVPGGGPFADAVRRYSRSLDDTAAHWMAILAMNQYGFFISGKGVDITDVIKDDVSGISVLLPFREVFACDPLPHSWDVTSDSIAAWVAHQIDANLVIATDVDGIRLGNSTVSSVSANDLTFETCVDSFLPHLLVRYAINCTVVNGKHFERVVDAVKGAPTTGTVIRGRE